MRALAMKAAIAMACVGLMAGSAEASTIFLNATGFTSGATFRYDGLGAKPGTPTGVGTGIYTLGSCGFDGTYTNCTVTGTYVETASSQFNPGATGSFTFIEHWLGNGPNQISAQSQTPGNNALFMYQLPVGAYFSLQLSNGMYGEWPTSPATPTRGFMGWNGVAGSLSCNTTGVVPSPCTIGNVGLTPGSSIFGNLASLSMSMQFPDPATPVPEPSTWLLLGTGIAALVARRRMRA